MGAKIISNSAGNCSVSFKFRTDFDHMTPDVLQMLRVNGSKVKVTEVTTRSQHTSVKKLLHVANRLSTEFKL